MSCLRPHPDGVLLAVRALPGARQARIREVKNGALVVAINAVPERGRANDALRDFLAERLTIRKSQLELIQGATTRQKVFLVRDASPDELRARLQSFLDRSAP